MSSSTGNQWRLEPARPRDAGAVLELYRSLAGTPGTTWSEDYPAAEDVAADTARGSLWCMWGEDGSLWGAASPGDDDEDIRDLSCWTPAEKSCELCRIGIRSELQGRGLGAALVGRLMEIAAAQGRDWVRLLVSRENPAAVRLYEKMGFTTCGELRMYEVDWVCRERRV